ISVSCKGQEQLVIGKDSLKFLVSDGLFVDDGLKVLQEHKEIDAKFVAKGSNTFGFQLSKYDENKPLVIDPLIYSTIIGDFRDDEAWSIALDGEGNAYVTGKTESIDFPTTPGAYNETYNGGEWDCFVFKLSADFSTLLYSTYVGGISHDGGSSIVLDNSGQVYVTGFTSSSDFPTTSDAYNRIFGGGYDCFVFRLSSSGSSLSYSSFFGGIGLDLGDSIALYNDNVVYVTGKAGSANFPTTVGAYNETFSGLFSDCFVFKLSADGVSLLYSTFVGGNGIDRVQSIAVDDEGNAYVTGYTSSSNFPTTLNAYNRTFGGVDDCFVFKLSTYGSTLLYSTFIGGNESEFGNSIALDNNGNAFVTGSTLSSNFPTTLNAYNRTYGGEGDCFVFKLSADSSSLLYSTFVGGNSSDGGYSIALDSEWNAHVTGYTSSSNFPTTLGAYDETYDDGGCIVFKLSADGSSLLYSTRIGGTDHENGESIALDSEGNAYVTGYTSSNDFPTTVRPFDFGPGGGSLKNVFVFKISLIAKTKRFGEPILKTNTLTITTLTLFTLITISIKKRRKRK
ncbi:MAG: SBBP repeat-containing protein, partial [Candidatus Heimdallarchaeota archaeon]|nr:SBBP repeat-containing protein [Candidatus Heimdallarchaeota archaeon]